jgi:hypothetical protein
MMCAFCRQDVSDPCHTIHEMQQRAEHHVERCEQAMQRQGGGSHPQRAPSADVPSGGQA